MSKVLTDTTTDKTVSDELDQGTSTDAPDNALSGPTDESGVTPEQQAIISESEQEANDVAEYFLTKIVNPKDALKIACEGGKRAYKYAEKAMKSVKQGAYTKDDFAGSCHQIEMLIKRKAVVTEKNLVSRNVRIYLWVEAVKAVCPSVVNLHLNTIANKLLPTLSFDPTNLTGEIKKNWLTWVKSDRRTSTRATTSCRWLNSTSRSLTVRRKSNRRSLPKASGLPGGYPRVGAEGR